MLPLRFRIATLMVLVALAGLGFAALRNANDFWASVAFTCLFASVLLALIGALARKGKARMPWAGYAVFGGGAMLIWLSTASSAPLAGFGFGIRGGGGIGGGRMGGGGGMRAMPGGGGGGLGGMGGGVRAAVPVLLPTWGLGTLQTRIGPPAARTVFDLLAYAQVSHSLGAMLFGLVGAVLCRLVAPKDGPQPDTVIVSPFVSDDSARPPVPGEPL